MQSLNQVISDFNERYLEQNVTKTAVESLPKKLRKMGIMLASPAYLEGNETINCSRLSTHFVHQCHVFEYRRKITLFPAPPNQSQSRIAQAERLRSSLGPVQYVPRHLAPPKCHSGSASWDRSQRGCRWLIPVLAGGEGCCAEGAAGSAPP